MDMNYGCDVSNRYTGYLDSSDHGNAMSNAASKNKRKTKKRRKSKSSSQKVVTVVDKCINTSQIIECDGNEDGSSTSEKQQQQQLFDEKTDGHHNDEVNVENHENDVNYTDGPTSLISCDSTVQSDTSKEATIGSDEQSNNTIEDQPTITETETKWSEICCEEEKAVAAAAAAAAEAAAAAAMDAQKYRDEPELVFKDQRVYPTVYFYNSNFGGPRQRRVVYDFHDGGRGNAGGAGGHGGRRHSNHSYNDASRTRQQMVKTQTNHDNNTEPKDQMQNDNQKKRHNRGGHRRKNYSARSDTTDLNKPGESSGMHLADDAEKSYNESNDRSSYGPSTQPPSNPLPPAQKYQNNSNNNNDRTHEFPKNRYNRFKNGMPERTFSRRRTDLVRNV